MLVWMFLYALLLTGVVWTIINAGFQTGWKVFSAGLVVIIVVLALVFLPITYSHEESIEYKLIRMENGSNMGKTIFVLDDNGTIVRVEVFNSEITYKDRASDSNYTVVEVTRLYEKGLIFQTDGRDINDIRITVYINTPNTY